MAVWTREHDADRPVGGAGGRTHRFTVDELQGHPIIIVTHEFYKGVRGAKARTYKQNGMTLPRVITFIDEKVNEIETYDVAVSDVAAVYKFVQTDDHGQEPLHSDDINSPSARPMPNRQLTNANVLSGKW